MKVKTANIPTALRERRQWVLWRTVERNGNPTKVPFRLSGMEAKSNDPKTWATFDITAHQLEWSPEYDGLGFMFAADDPFCGVDLDGCRDPQSGQVAEWARQIIEAFETYAEVSPSGTGVKLWCIGKSPFETGKKKSLAAVERIGDKQPAIEIYDRLRYFAMTGLRLAGMPHDPQERQPQLDWLKTAYWPEPPKPLPPDFRGQAAVVERARKYVSKMPDAISGQGGHNQTFHVACVLVLGFGLGTDAAIEIMREYNQRCRPEWSDRELWHKVKSADQQPGERNYLRNVVPEKWESVNVPTYGPIAPRIGPRIERLDEAAKRYVLKIGERGEELLSIGIQGVDYAIGGGVEPGEMVLMCARPSHGKSMAALQAVHGWTAAGIPCVFASEEMSALALGKRSVQFITSVPQEHWHTSLKEVNSDIEHYSAEHAPTYVIEQCGSVENVVEQIEIHAAEHGVRCAVVDYAQLLRAPGKSRYEQVSNTSQALKSVALKTKVVLLVLCQMGRQIEARKKFIPVMSDIKETGQLEQDADVILFLVWPHQLNKKLPPEEYQVWISKNRNRPIREGMVQCKFFPSRQMLLQPAAKDMSNYTSEFDAYNDRKDFA